MTIRRPRPLPCVLALAAMVRALHWLAVRDQPFVAQLVMDSAEYDRWARAIVAGTAPVEAFFQPPLYPYFVATLYAIGRPGPDIVYLAQIALAVAGCWALAQAGRLLVDERLGVLAAGLFAVSPTLVFHDVQLLKESLAVSLVSFLLWALAASWRRGSLTVWLAAGLLTGLLALLRENLLLVAPLLALLALRPAAPRVTVLRRIAVYGGAVLLPLLPVSLRNAAAGGGLLPTTFQGGVNFYIGNNPEADGTYRPVVPGRQVPAEERRQAVRLAEEATGRELTPAEVSRWWLGRSLAWARAQPLAFTRLQLRKLRLFWSWYEWPDAVDYYYVRSQSPVLWLPWPGFGAISLLAAGSLYWLRREPGRLAPVLLWVAASCAATTAFFLFSRYRLPTLVGLLLLAAVPLRAAWEALAARPRRWWPVGFVVAALALPLLAPHQPRWDLVHGNLGMLYQQAGKSELAAREYRAALAANPRDFDLWLKLGTLAARGRRYEEARRYFATALTLEPRASAAHANLGSACLVLGDNDCAARHLRRALELEPGQQAAAHNLQLLERRIQRR